MKTSLNLAFAWSLVILFFYCFVNPAYTTTAQKNIVGLWLFDEGEGKVVKDSSPNGNHVDFFGDPKWVKGKFGFGLEFDGANDYVAAPDSDSLDITDKITIVAWIKGDAWPAANHVVRKIADTAQDSVYILRIQPDTIKIYLNTKDAPDKRFGYQFAGATSLKTGTWYHVGMVYDGKEIKAYLNGKEDGSLAATGEIVVSKGELRIGRGDPAGYFDGVIDEVGLFDTALTEGEIKELMEKGLRGFAALEPTGKLTATWADVKAQ